ncbi:DGC domain protein [Acididesulfobacillus acetoxydans]|uniref:DGC domain n=1 Tax=Acididesulfobacillus acetoxydans TaxID=1561005 RepID=A0A8S0WG19_9FIRM|nr:putative zinc-binding protein [Acididesulfobacillus acetoxydans]CAA7601522.1 DGC domain protein [Acididesulfobacillus acetoxydans]CEJ07009.1 DGC domain [Acididesulfobacillus acetoxydans]
MSKESVMLIPCSGIGKVHGLIGREAVFKVKGELRPQDTDLACLAEIVTQDAEVQERMNGRLTITVDGCPKMCAEKNVRLVGGEIFASLRVVDAFRTHRGAQAGSATELTSDGWQISDELADQIALKVDEARQGGKGNG